METIVIICLITIFVALLLIVLVNQYNKFQLLIIKITKGEQNINSLLQEEYNILVRYADILKGLVKVNKEDFDDFSLLNTASTIYKLDKKIKEMNNVINKYLDSNEKIVKNTSVMNINRELHETNISLSGCKKYYNDNVINYNHLCTSFPSKIIAKIYRYKSKEFIDENMRDELKILNDNEEK